MTYLALLSGLDDNQEDAAYIGFGACFCFTKIILGSGLVRSGSWLLVHFQEQEFNRNIIILY